MANDENKKDVKGSLRGMFNSVKSSVQDIKLPDVKLPDVKLPEVKLPDVKLSNIKLPEVKMPGILQKKDDQDDAPNVQEEIRTISVQSAIKIIYYMISADGEMHENELQRFGEISKEMDPDFDSKREDVIASCEGQMNKLIDPEDYFAVLQDGVEDAISIGKNTKDGGIAPKVLIWDLITVAYSDGVYDENERKLLKYVVRKLNVDKAVFLEMESSYLTLEDLEKELAWIKTTDRPYLKIEAMVNEIADRKTVIFESIKDLMAF